MKAYLSIIFILVCAFSALSQTPSASPVQSNTLEKPSLKKFGSSLEKFQKKGKTDSKNSSSNKPEDSETIRVKTDLVVNDVLVVNQKGNVILGLQKNDFIVTENSAPQEIGLFSFGASTTIPRSIVLIIDYSGSQLPFIKNSIEAAKKLVDKLAPQDRMAIVTDDVKLLVDFTKDKNLLKSNLDSLLKKAFSKHVGRSEQYTALVAVLNELFDEEDIRPIVILQSDGDELFALRTAKTDKDLPPSNNSTVFGIPQKNYSFADVRLLVGKSRATVYSIVPGFRLIGIPKDEQLAKTRIMDERSAEYMSLIFGYSVGRMSEKDLLS